MIFSSPKKSSALFLSALLLVQSIFLSSCGYLPFIRRSKLIPTTENVEVSISKAEEGPFTPITNRNKKVYLNHFRGKYYVKQQRDGYVENVSLISRRGFNWMKRLDMWTLYATDLALILMGSFYLPKLIAPSNSFSLAPPEAAMISVLTVGTAGWGAVIPEPIDIYRRKIELPELLSVLKKDSGQLYLASSDHEFELKNDGIKMRYFNSKEDYDIGWGGETKDTVETFDLIDNMDLYGNVASMLKDIHFGIDSAEATNTNTLMVNSKIQSVLCSKAGSNLRCSLKTSWALETKDKLQYVYAARITSESDWHTLIGDTVALADQETVMKSAITEALTKSLHEFIRLDTIQSILSLPVPIPLAHETELILPTGNKFCTTVAEAAKSVMIVVTDKGHGSGCVVTPDGYIITNAHVVEDDTSNIEGIFTDDTKDRVPLKFIRMNKAMDLALLKVDSTGFIPFALGSKSDVEIGADVYAIGTPANIDLGRTLTRGIISGKRKFRGHQMIQTDVAINPGNSGGALIRKSGILIGIVTSEIKNEDIDDIGFAIPAQEIERALKIKLKR